MIRSYTADDLPAVRAALSDEPDKLVLLETYLAVSDMMYFDLWLSEDVSAVIFRSYGSFYMKLTEEADLDEVIAFLQFMPMIGSLRCSSPVMEAVAIRLPGTSGTSQVTVARLASDALLRDYELDVTPAVTMADHRLVYSLLRGEVGRGLPEIDDYCFTRRALVKSGLGRTVSLIKGSEVFSTASTAGETDLLALIADVVTNRRYRRQGLSSALLSQLCRELLSEGKTPIVTYTTAEAARLYESLGFTEAGSDTLLHF